MLFVLALVAAVGYMFLTKQTIEANITDQVNEYLAQQQTFTHLGVQDSSDAEIKRRLKREWAGNRTIASAHECCAEQLRSSAFH